MNPASEMESAFRRFVEQDLKTVSDLDSAYLKQIAILRSFFYRGAAWGQSQSLRVVGRTFDNCLTMPDPDPNGDPEETK